MTKPILQCKDVTKAFGGLLAVNKVKSCLSENPLRRSELFIVNRN